MPEVRWLGLVVLRGLVVLPELEVLL